MTDGALVAVWLGILAGGLVACVALARAGVPMTSVRDLLHVGAGIWPLGWPWWSSAAAPCAVAAAGAAGVLLVPLLAPWLRAAAKVRDAISGGDERFEGVALYALSSAAFTAAGFGLARGPAAAALLALALGDGLGGAIGHRFGRHRFRAPGAKSKSLEGTAAVALFAALGAWLGLWAMGGGPMPPLWVLAACGLAAAAVEAVSPRATDNLTLPAAVFALLWLVLPAQSAPAQTACATSRQGVASQVKPVTVHPVRVGLGALSVSSISAVVSAPSCRRN